MALVEVVLQYRPHGIALDGQAAPLAVGSTDSPHVLRAVKEELLRQARREVELWEGIDPGVATMREAEATRLEQVLEFLMPDDTPPATKRGLKLVAREESEEPDP